MPEIHGKALMATAFITHDDCMKHTMGEYHPERPARLAAIHDQLITSGIAGFVKHHEAPLAKMVELGRVHPAEYVESVRMTVPERGIVHLDPDTALCPQTWDAALRAAGAVVLGTDLVMAKGSKSAFCAVRPPGHHAMRGRAMGFCIFNNVAVGAKHALEHHGLERVAIADFDVHHGNGTEDIFSGDPRVLMVGTFQHPFYPYSGTDNPASNMANVPLPAGTGSQGFRAAVERVWLPALERFKPQMIFISAGFDAHVEDEMAMLRITESDYGWVTTQLKAIADRYGEGRIVSVLEGGYALSALGRSVVAHLRALGGF